MIISKLSVAFRNIDTKAEGCCRTGCTGGKKKERDLPESQRTGAAQERKGFASKLLSPGGSEQILRGKADTYACLG